MPALIYLLNDSLVIAKSEKGYFEFVSYIPLSECIIRQDNKKGSMIRIGYLGTILDLLVPDHEINDWRADISDVINSWVMRSQKLEIVKLNLSEKGLEDSLSGEDIYRIIDSVVIDASPPTENSEIYPSVPVAQKITPKAQLKLDQVNIEKRSALNNASAINQIVYAKDPHTPKPDF